MEKEPFIEVRKRKVGIGGKLCSQVAAILVDTRHDEKLHAIVTTASSASNLTQDTQFHGLSRCPFACWINEIPLELLLATSWYLQTWQKDTRQPRQTIMCSVNGATIQLLHVDFGDTVAGSRQDRSSLDQVESPAR